MSFNFFFYTFFVFSKSIVTIIDTIQFFPKDKTCLGFSRVNGEVTVLPGLKVLFFALWTLILGLSKGDPIREVALLVRWP